MEYETQINWYDLKDYEILYLNEGIFKDLINQGIKKAGSLSKLCLKLNSMQLYNILKNNEGISVKTLRKLLDYLEIKYDLVNDAITEIRKGTKPSIKNPKFPINLQNNKIGSLIGHLMSDGCLYKDNSRKNLIRTKYCSDEKEGINNFVNSLNKVFGEVHFNQEVIRNCIQIRIGNGVIGEVFRRAGVTVGKKYKFNEGLPWIIKDGTKEIKRAYLSAIFDDEGSVGKKPFPYVILSRNIHFNFSNEERDLLERYIVPIMNKSYFPTGHSTKQTPIRVLKELLEKGSALELLKIIIDSKPKLLVDESNLLKEDLGIDNSVYIIALQLTSNGNYSVKSSLVIRKKKDVLKFYENIGFSFSKKQKKLKEALINRRWLDNGIETIQHIN